MRVLITTSPGIGHIFPTISTAWALRAAGHDVILATGGHHELASRAGLIVVDTAPGVDFVAMFRGFSRPQTDGELPQTDGGQRRFQRPPVGGPSPEEWVGHMFGTVSAKFTDETVRLVRSWRPDLVVFSPLQGVGPLAAQVAGVPAVMHGFGFNISNAVWRNVVKYMAEDFVRHGVIPPDSATVIDVTPPSMVDGTVGERLPMRYVPYNGGAVMAPWLLEPRTKPRIAVTLGSVVPMLGGASPLAPLMAAAGDVPAEFVVTKGGLDDAAFGTLPGNVRLVDWVPLHALLRASDAVIHHGGAGSTLTALDAGLPQLILPQGADQFQNAAAVAKTGAGDTVESADLTADRVVALLADDAARSAAEAIAKDMAGQPTPADVVPALIALAS